tara:strand:+ start:581 stop:2095 length:1515 start_codon:yes stop_codon:yes gene_type:complete
MGAIAPIYGSILPSLTQQALQSNYLSFTDAAGGNFAQQYLPEVYEAEVERYGNRTLNGFLRMVGAEMPMTSDQVVWSEQNRLHVAYNNCQIVTNAAAALGTVNIPTDDNAAPWTGQNQAINVINQNDTVVLMNTDTGVTIKAVVSAVAAGAGNTTDVTCLAFQETTLATLGVIAAGVTGNIKLFVYGSVFAKGTVGNPNKSAQPQFTQFHNTPIIIKDRYQISGSDTAQIGWVEVATEDGTSGYLWYLKSESETRLRFDDYLEMAMIEGEIAARNGVDGAAADGMFQANKANVPGFTPVNAHGTEGLFAAIQTRGNIMSGFSAGTGISDFDQILKNLDTQGAIEENMLFLNRATDLGFDDMLSQISGGIAGGTAYGLFENSEQMALNLGFSGFRRGSYDFYKTSWKYLNDASTRGAVGTPGIDGVLIPAGTSTVYDQVLGTNIRRPFLHVRYRASQADDRRYKNWITGSVGGAYTSDLDAMEVHFLSERCLVTQAANNFVLFQA